MAKYSYNGVILPERPTTGGYQLIYTEGDGYYYLAVSDMPFFDIYSQLCHNSSASISIYRTTRSATTWDQGTYRSIGDNEYTAITYANYIWSNHDINSYTLSSEGLEQNGVAYRYTEPVLQDKRVLEAFPKGILEVNSYGATGIYVGAKVRDTLTGSVIDISDKANYSIDVFQAPYVYLDGSRQLIISEDCPYTGVSVTVTWDELPDQKAVVQVWLKIESGGGESGGGSGGDSPGDIVITDVTDIVITMYPNEVAPGGHATFEVLVKGTGNYNGEYILELNGQESQDTFYNEGSGRGNIWVAADETSDFVMLTATSMQNPLIQTSEMLYIDHSAVVDPSPTAEQLERAFQQGYATAKAYMGNLRIVSGTVLSVDQENMEEELTEVADQMKRAYFRGFMAAVGSLTGKGKIEGPEPVAHSYNGVILPALPEWDREKYPYAVITQCLAENADWDYRVTYYPYPAVLKLLWGSYGLCMEEKSTHPVYYIDRGEDDWEYSESNSNINVNIVADISLPEGSYKLIWSNVDLYVENSKNPVFTTYDPDPVYE